jgi:restriction system protein
LRHVTHQERFKVDYKKMTIPDYQTLMLPLLELAADGKEHFLRDVIEKTADEFNLTEDERKELLPSGQQAIFTNRVAWARTYLKQAGLLEATRRGYFQITKRGKQVLAEQPTKIDVKYLEKFPEFLDFRTRKKDKNDTASEERLGEETPEESLETAYQKVRQELAQELLRQIKQCSPLFFEKLVIDLLVKMGYGGTRRDAGKAIGKSGDGGIDGIIKEDRLGLDIIYIQAKRWEGNVSRPEVQKFAGALQGQRAKKGIFITTSSFTQEAWDYVSRIDSKIVLIDGDLLAQFMLDHSVGVSTVATYEIKKVDSDYFSEE